MLQPVIALRHNCWFH